MSFIADFHIHSKYSRATSPQMDLEHLDTAAKIKGIKVLTTSDFTHPEWFQNLKGKLEPAEQGLFKLKNGQSETRFILTSEISCIYTKNNRVRKIHLLIFAPDFETVEKINVQLGWVGNLKADGRPILGLDAKELTKIVLNINSNCLVVPAHCLLPTTFLHTDEGIKMIKDINIDDRVYTHKSRMRKVKQVLKRHYKGSIYTIRPYYFRLGLTTTPEHPYLILKNDRYKGKSNYYGEQLKRDYFKNKKPEWAEASKVKIGDILLFPRFNKKTESKEVLKLDEILNPISVKYVEEKIASIGNKVNWLPNIISIDKDFCRLVGYYLAEGYTISDDGITFCFKKSEKDYINDVLFLMKKLFGLEVSKIREGKDNNGIELIYYSKILNNISGHLFYTSPKIKRAFTKVMPTWMLKLPLEKQVEIFKGWWRGDLGCTSSRELMNQMKIILLRLGIIPSINLFQTKESFNNREHRIKGRLIKANYSQFQFSNLTFFNDNFNLLKDPCFRRFNTKLNRRYGWIDKGYIYIPVKDIGKEDYQGEVYNLEVEGDNSYVAEFATIHNCWTPWFSVFGSKSGFDSLEECFGEYTKYIFAGETGLSSNPLMNWRLSALDKMTLISNSDAHSPAKIGREANVFDTELSYQAIIDAVKQKDSKKFLYTVEFFPEEGKYHYDGHRNCGVSLSPQETKKYNGICPVCGRPLTIGVLNRVEELADRPEGFKPENTIPYKSLIPLEEIIAESRGVGTGTKEVGREYGDLIQKFGSEFNVLLDIPISDLKSGTLPEITEAISRVRQGKVSVEPGYDGVYGKIRIFSTEEKKEISGQKTLF